MPDIWPQIAPAFRAAKQGYPVQATVRWVFDHATGNWEAEGPVEYFEHLTDTPSSVGLVGRNLGVQPDYPEYWQPLEFRIEKAGAEDATLYVGITGSATDGITVPNPEATTWAVGLAQGANITHFPEVGGAGVMIHLAFELVALAHPGVGRRFPVEVAATGEPVHASA